jgi:L-alanine-DL-glutamate epimerase-like enolase superfamily enzyme
MMEVSVLDVTVPLKRKFAIAGGQADSKTNLLTVMNNRYYGEASPSVAYGPDIEELKSQINRGLELLQQTKEPDISTLEQIGSWDLHPVARSAIMTMVLNYLSGEQRRYPWEVLSLGSPVGVRSSWTVAFDSPEKMLAAIAESPFPIVKIKMGNEQDVLLLDGLEKIEDKEIRVDANGGWSCAKAEEMIFHLARLGVTVIEQPTNHEYVKEWPHLKAKHQEVELIMDEGMNTLDDYDRYKDLIDGINIKPEKAGGIVPAARLAAKAQADGKKVMLGCMVGSSISMAPSIYMSSLADYFDLDGPLLLEADLGRGIRYDREAIEVDREIIGGPQLKRDVLQKYRSA